MGDKNKDHKCYSGGGRGGGGGGGVTEVRRVEVGIMIRNSREKRS